MTFEGLTYCPSCTRDISRQLRDVLRKADDDAIVTFECAHCDTEIVVRVAVRHKVNITRADMFRSRAL